MLRFLGCAVCVCAGVSGLPLLGFAWVLSSGFDLPVCFLYGCLFSGFDVRVLRFWFAGVGLVACCLLLGFVILGFLDL